MPHTFAHIAQYYFNRAMSVNIAEDFVHYSALMARYKDLSHEPLSEPIRRVGRPKKEDAEVPSAVSGPVDRAADKFLHERDARLRHEASLVHWSENLPNR